ncbi:MAG: TIGR03032 family protein, partial [Planctomycetota bacterium]
MDAEFPCTSSDPAAGRAADVLAQRATWAGLAATCCDAFPELLASLRATLLVTTYQAGKLVVIRSRSGRLSLCCRSFRRAMGLDVAPDRIALVTRREVWTLRNAPEVIGSLRTGRARHDACFVPRHAHVTGDIRAHEIAFADDALWLVNTRFSCLCSLDDAHGFVPRWKPSFITDLAPEDRCHLNGLAMHDGRPKFVTALGSTDTPEGWRENRIAGGVVIDVDSSEIVLSGLCMPHSPRWHDGALWLLNSGRGELLRVDPQSGRRDVVARLPGYARGLHLAGEFAFVALSRIRETATFAGMPVTQWYDRL